MTYPILELYPAFSEVGRRLRVHLADYDAALDNPDRALREVALLAVLRSFSTLLGRDVLHRAGETVLTLDGLTEDDLYTCVLWLPLDISLYLQLCTHPLMTDAIRLSMFYRLDLGRALLSPTGLARWRDHLEWHHPLTLGAHEAGVLHNNIWHGEVLNRLSAATAHNVSLQRALAALMPTWDQKPDALFDVAYGICA